MNFHRSSITWVSFHGIGHLLADPLPCVTHVPGLDPTPALSYQERSEVR